MLPDPVYALGRFVAEIGVVKIAAQKENEDDIVSEAKEIGLSLVDEFDFGILLQRTQYSISKPTGSIYNSKLFRHFRLEVIVIDSAIPFGFGNSQGINTRPQRFRRQIENKARVTVGGHDW